VRDLFPFLHVGTGDMLRKIDCSFDLCIESGASDAFFPYGRHAVVGNYVEVPCSEWSGYDGPELWNGACLAGEDAKPWPSTACGNRGARLFLCLHP
jgi:hypothetical protein